MTRRLHEYLRGRAEHFRAADRRSQSAQGRDRRQWAKLEDLKRGTEQAPAGILLDGLTHIHELEDVTRRGRLAGYITTAGLESGCRAWAGDFTFLGRFFSRRDAVDAVIAVARGVR